MLGNLIYEPRNICAGEVLNQDAIHLNFALINVAEGLEELSTPIASMLEAELTFERMNFRHDEVELFLLLP